MLRPKLPPREGTANWTEPKTSSMADPRCGEKFSEGRDGGGTLDRLLERSKDFVSREGGGLLSSGVLRRGGDIMLRIDLQKCHSARPTGFWHPALSGGKKKTAKEESRGPEKFSADTKEDHPHAGLQGRETIC